MIVKIYKNSKRVNCYICKLPQELMDELKSSEIVFSQTNMSIRAAIIDSQKIYKVSKQRTFSFAAKFDHSIEGSYTIEQEGDIFYLNKEQ